MRSGRFLVAVALAVLPLATAAPAVAVEPDDPGAAQQWGLRKIRAIDAWPASKGKGVVVAVIDTGVAAGHPDLTGRVLKGRDFVDNDDDAADVKGHGTHVAGTIAANSGNGLGVASVAPGAKILPVRVLGSSGEGDPGDVADGISWAVARGAKVINLSLAQDDALPAAGDDLLRDTRVDRAIKNAARKGVVVVVAAGNNDKGGRAETSYDATVAGVIVVGAATRGDKRAAYSNYGSGLDVLAPGGGSATDAKSCVTDDWIVSTWWNPATKKSDYGGGCGTSMAVAHVSGIAALLMARGYSAAGATSRIISTAVDMGAPGRDAESGAGRVDAFRALGPAVRPSPRQTTAGGIGTATPSAGTIQPPASGRPEPQSSPRAFSLLGRRAADESRTVPMAVAALLIAGVIGAHARNARRFFAPSRPNIA